MNEPKAAAAARASALREEAFALLGEARIPDLLEHRFEASAVVGSVALDLMTWRDIDLCFPVDRDERQRFVDLMRPLFDALEGAGHSVFRATFNDEWAVPRGDYGSGYYWGVRVRTTANAVWKMDLWGWDRPTYVRKIQEHEALHAALLNADRDLVLRLKADAQLLPGFRDAITSYDIYRFVLAGAGETLDQLRTFSTERRRSGY